MKSCTTCISKEENALLEKAICFATERHTSQRRKGNGKPYIMHPLETMTILNSMYADIPLLIAGVLHDVLEDTKTSEEEMRAVFGNEVTELVLAHTEDKSKTWDERKLSAIVEAAVGERRVQMLILADKVANLRSMQQDYSQMGDALWENFHAPMEKQAWYYGNMLNALQELSEYEETAYVYEEMVGLFEDLFEDVFVDFYEDSED